MSEAQQHNSKKAKWLPLESNPEIMNKYVHNLGVSTDWAYTDVWGLDPELLQMIPQPVVAVLLLFPITAEQDAAQETTDTQKVSKDLIFYKQTIPNACGTIGLLHSLANNTHAINIKDGPLKRLIEKTRELTPEERAKVLEENEELEHAHREFSEHGQSRVQEDTDLHFTAFVQKDGFLYELDGRRPYPINHGPSSDLLSDSARAIKKFIDQNPNEGRFNVIALAPNQN
ncbi:5596_t:CDS:1 [Ambispora leptoticha]|uniref:Ubiquitin carboxyl-terminal hydrolase n=1 Tax=Ambispora leptoticha TaxID=144679 RepID=A0A9N9E917_9GLOM|nr:5596_t:CDS:1 [Ambispora leptoticha]